MTEDPEKYKDRLHKYYEETLLQDEQQFVDKYVNSVYNKVMEELLRTHRPPLTTIEALEKKIPYYVTQLRIYTETTPDAAPAVIAGLGGMQYGLDKGNQPARRRIWTLYHPADLTEEEDTEDIVIMELGAITAEKDWNEDYRADDQLHETPGELFFANPDYENVSLCEEPEAQDYWESGLTVESLEALRLGSWYHSHSMCYNCKNKGHIKANCLDR